MKKLILTAILFLIGTTSALAFATSANNRLSDVSYLRKLSYHLRGEAPSEDEYDQLSSLRGEGQIQDFFQRKISEYMSSPGYLDRLIFMLSERFEIKTPVIDNGELGSFSPYTRRYISNGYTLDSLTDLFSRLGSENLSWDTLLTGKDYNAYPMARNSYSDSSFYDFNFFRVLKPDLPMVNTSFYDSGNSQTDYSKPKSIHIQFGKDDPRVAGALTTPRFLARYSTTNVNKNRRRAAAVFRIFMCNPMVPIIPAAADKKSEVLDSAFADQMRLAHANVAHKEMISGGITITDADRHGSDPRCAACHNLLDPMGRTFQNLGVSLSSEPAPGKLVLKRSDGQAIAKYVSGIGQLGEEITKQPEYENCQVQYLWQQFIGRNVPLATARLNELKNTFDSVGRRTNDFIRALVTAPEFRLKPNLNAQVSFAQVKPLLDRCDSCHITNGNFTNFSTADIDQVTFKKMIWRLNLPDNNKDKMPKDRETWAKSDLDLVRTWLSQGASGPDGKTMIAKGARP